MKKVLIGALVLAMLVVAGAVLLLTNLGSVIRAAVERFGSDATQTKVTLVSADVSLTSGEGRLGGLEVANPAGFSEANAIELGEISLRLDPASVTTDTIVVKEVEIQGPKVRYEVDGRLATNLGRIQDNLDAYARSAGGGGSGSAGSGEKRFVIENLYVRGGSVAVGTALARGAAVSCPLPEIHLTGIGRKSGGATAGEVATQVLSSITKGALDAAVKNGLTKAAKGAIDSAVDKLKGILGK